MSLKAPFKLPIVIEMLIFMTAVSFSSTSYAALDPFIKSQFLMTHAQIGLITAMMFLGVLTIQFVSGHLIDEYGPYTASKIAFGMVAAGAFLLFISYSSLFIYSGYYTIGLGFGIVPPATNRGIMDAYKPGHASKMGIKQAGFSGGAVISAFSLPVIALYFSLRYAFLVLLLISLLLFAFTRGDGKERDSKWSLGSYFGNISRTLRDRRLRAISLASIVFSWAQQTMLAYYALFEEFRGFHIITAEIFLGTLLAGSVLGIGLWPSISSKIFGGRRFLTLSIIMAFSGVLYLILANITQSFFLNEAVAFFIGFTTAGWNSTYMTSVSEIAPAKSIGMFSSVSLMFMTLGTIFGTPVSGNIVDNFSYSYMWTVMGISQLVFSLIFYLISLRIKYDQNAFTQVPETPSE